MGREASKPTLGLPPMCRLEPVKEEMETQFVVGYPIIGWIIVSLIIYLGILMLIFGLGYWMGVHK